MARNYDGAVQGGVNGAKIGGQIYGGWGALIGGAIGFLVGMNSQSPVQLQLETMDQYNKDVTKNTTQALFDLQRQRVSERLRTSSALSQYKDNEMTANSTVKSQYGAMDLVGSSAGALTQVMSYQTEQAVAQEWYNFGVGIDNYNTDVYEVVNRGIGSLQNNINVQSSGGTVSFSDLKSGYQGAKSMLGLTGTNSSGSSSGGFSSGFQFGSQPTSSTGGDMSSMDWSSFSFGS